MEASILYLHVGPPKTATTFLQEEVLSRVRSMAVLYKPTVEFDAERLSFGDLFSFSPDIWRNSGGGAFARLVRLYPALEEGTTIISSEGIFGGFASPQPWLARSEEAYGPVVRTDRQTDGRPSLDTIANHIETLTEVVPESGISEVRVLFSTRRQDTKLASGYAQMSSRVKGASQSHFEAWVRHMIDDPVGHYAGGGEKLNYYRWWKKCVEVVGRENVCVLPYELLNEDPAEFLRKWLGFLHLPEADDVVRAVAGDKMRKRNVQSISETVWSLKPVKRIAPAMSMPRMLQSVGFPSELTVRWPDFSREKEVILTPELSKEILRVFEDDNRHLEKACPEVDLERYGYY